MLRPKQIKAIEIIVNQTDKTDEVAREVGVNPQTIRNWLDDAEFQDVLIKQIRKGFSKLAAKARIRLGQLMDSTNPSVALGACNSVLSKAGLDAPVKTENTNTVINVTVGDD